MVHKLKAAQVSKLGEGRHADSLGLYLHVVGGSRFWVLRYTSPATKRRRVMSLGTLDKLSLADAREKRDEYRKLIRSGVDPMAEDAPAPDNTLASWVAKWFDANKGTLKNDGAAGRWMSPLKVHVLPNLGSKDVAEIRAGDVIDVLRPIWKSRVSAAQKAADRLGIVLRYAAAYVPGIDRMAVPDARQQLGSQDHAVTHIVAMPWRAVPVFYAGLGLTPTELALRLLILSASRPGPVRLARAEEFDLDRAVWTIPADKLKFKPTKRRPKPQPFRIPLSPEACRVIETALPLARDGWLFTARMGKPLSDAAMNVWLTTNKIAGRSHGFRTSFRTWCQDHRIDRDLAEMSLGHVVGDTVESSYARSDMLDLRREVLVKWQDHVISKLPAA